jgi:hypothetical protein
VAGKEVSLATADQFNQCGAVCKSSGVESAAGSCVQDPSQSLGIACSDDFAQSLPTGPRSIQRMLQETPGI